MHRVRAVALGALLASSVTGHAHAQSLRVSPVTIDLPPAAKSAVLNVGNDSDKPIAVQARVFRWTQAGGEDKLERTDVVAVSPPLLSVGGKSSGIVRVVRVGQTPVTGEESYRVLLDEVPDRSRMQAGTVVLALRDSVPVFFHGMDALRGDVRWSVSSSGSKLFLQAANPGQKRVKLSGLHVTDGAVRKLISIDGLAGYVLGGQTKIWELPVPKSGLNAGTTLSIEATSEAGPINASATVGKSG
ncbi:MAG: molecular chaperone [Rhodomicrobium sp.]